MYTNFEIAAGSFYHKDKFDISLDSYLFDTIERLQAISTGDSPLWEIVVYDLLYTYMLRVKYFHFHLSTGRKNIEKPSRQIDFEEHIQMLEFTDGRKYITNICSSALRGKGWLPLQKVAKWNWQDLFHPLKFVIKIISTPYFSLWQWQQKRSSALYALEVFLLFRKLNDEECDAVFDYLKSLDDREEWGVYLIVGLLMRPGKISKPNQKHLEKIVATRSFRDKKILLQTFSILAQTSSDALKRFVVAVNDDIVERRGISTELLDTLLLPSSQNPNATRFLLDLELNSLHGYTTSKYLFREKIELISDECLDVVLSEAEKGDESRLFLFDALFGIIDQTTAKGHSLLVSSLKSKNDFRKYYSALALYNLNVPDFSEIEEVYDCLLDLCFGDMRLRGSDINNFGKLHEKVVDLLVEIGKDRISLLRKFIVNLRYRWWSEFSEIVESVFSEVVLEKRIKLDFAEQLLCGEIEECKSILDTSKAKIGDETHEYLSVALNQISTRSVYGLINYEDRYGGNLLISLCSDYLSKITPCLIALKTKITDIESAPYLAASALLCFTNLDLSAWSYYKQGDTFGSLCFVISKAIKIINYDYSEEDLVQLLKSYADPYRYNNKLVYAAMSSFPKSNIHLLDAIQKGVAADSPEAKKALLNVPGLLDDGVNLIIQGLIKGKINADARDNLFPVDESGVPLLIEAIRNREKLTDNEISQTNIFVYAIKALWRTSAISEEVVEICKNIVKEKIPLFYDGYNHKWDQRPIAAWALGKIRPVRRDIVDFLINVVTSRPSPRWSFGNVMWTKVAAIEALAEIGSDKTNNLNWNEREKITDVIMRYVAMPFQNEGNQSGGENIFSDKPSDAVYSSALLIVNAMRNYWSQTDYEIKVKIN